MNNADKTWIGYCIHNTTGEKSFKFQISTVAHKRNRWPHDSEYDKLYPHVDILTSGYQIVMPPYNYCASSLYINRGKVSARSYVRNAGRGQLSSEWRHNENSWLHWRYRPEIWWRLATCGHGLQRSSLSNLRCPYVYMSRGARCYTYNQYKSETEKLLVSAIVSRHCLITVSP